MIEITSKRFEELTGRDILEAEEKYDEISIDFEEQIVWFKRTSYMMDIRK